VFHTRVLGVYVMKRIIFLFIVFFITVNVFAQQVRLIELPTKQTPVPGQSIYAFSISMRNDRSVIISIDDVRIGHFFNGEAAEIVVPNGRHIVRAYQLRWDAKAGGWRDDDDDRLTNTLTDEKLPVQVNNGPKLKGGRITKVIYTQPAIPTNVATTNTATTDTKPSSGVGMEGAIARASVVFVGELPANSTIAVISISANNPDLAAFAIDELEYQLVTARQFTIVDRKTLDSIRTEQQFQISGEVSDQSAVSIGNLLGASIVITGSITGTGNSQRITLKALEVKTAQIVSMAREQF
jgi:TolB-like protein